MTRLFKRSRLLQGVAGFALLAGLSRSSASVRTMIKIHAPREAVWTILTDTAAYPEWNSVIREFQGTLRPGKCIRFVLRASSGSRVSLTPTVLRVEDGYELRWRGSAPGLLSASHYFLLSTTSGGATVLQHGEDYQGVLVPFLQGSLIRSLTPDFDKINREIKRRAEQVG